MKDEQDCEILSALVVEDKMTAYALSKETGISVPQINFRIEKLVFVGVVDAFIEENKTSYSIHPVFKSKELVEEIAEHIKDIFDVVDKSKETSIDGIKVILGFMLNKTEELELTEEGLSIVESKVNDFRRDLSVYALEHDLKIMNVKGWTNNKIEWMALNGRKCACAPDKRMCPCLEGLEEINKIGNCKCSVFSR